MLRLADCEAGIRVVLVAVGLTQHCICSYIDLYAYRSLSRLGREDDKVSID